jgi:DNA-binding NarL/FixJ family response regulator
LAFVDGRMPPGWDGIETIRHLWQECPDIQVVLCTAYSDYSWQDIRRVLGESDSLLILKKPFDNVEVLQLSHALTRCAASITIAGRIASPGLLLGEYRCLTKRATTARPKEAPCPRSVRRRDANWFRR